MALTKDGSRVFVTNQHDDSVSVLDGVTYEMLATLKVGDYREGVLIAPDQRHALVACWMDDVFVSIDIATLNVDARLNVGTGPRAFGQFIAP